MNPMTAEMGVMRTNLWPGLVSTFLYNQNRQQSRIRLFEIGLRFIINNDDLEQQNVVSGLISGNAFPDQWGISSRSVDFYDLKGDLESLFSLTLDSSEFAFISGQHSALHPGQTAFITRQGEVIGVIGGLHPQIKQALDIKENLYLFEINLEKLQVSKMPRYQEVSKFPSIKRDLAILVSSSIPSSLIQDTIRKVAGDLLQHIHLFDVYQGKGIANHQKSLALALILQHQARTLRDEDVADVMNRVMAVLKEQFAAELRG
jgi:phenylalanyl-tRNA synthetase beta chain